jgi:hypothetical protein
MSTNHNVVESNPKIVLDAKRTRVTGPIKSTAKTKKKGFDWMDVFRSLVPDLGCAGSDGFAPSVIKATVHTESQAQTLYNGVQAFRRRHGIYLKTSSTRNKDGLKEMTIWKVRKPRSTSKVVAETVPSVKTDKGETTNGNLNGSYLPLEDAFELLKN